MMSTSPSFSMTFKAAAVVPPGLVTDSRSAAAPRPVSTRSRPAPSTVCSTSARAVTGSNPMSTAACIIASARRNTYAGPEALTAVAACMSASSIITVRPSASKRRRASASSPGCAPLPMATALMPAPIWHAMLGITRITRAPPPPEAPGLSASRMTPLRSPAMIEMMTFVPSSGAIRLASAAKA
jgi:hypothetical protein